MGPRQILTLNDQARILRDPKVADAEAVIKGTRVTLRTVLASLAEGATTAEILKDFPTLTEDDVGAAIAFAVAAADVVWDAAQADGRFLITRDLDFSDARKYEPGRHHGPLLVRLSQPGRQAVFERLSMLFGREDVETGVAASSPPRLTRYASDCRIDRVFSMTYR